MVGSAGVVTAVATEEAGMVAVEMVEVVMGEEMAVP